VKILFRFYLSKILTIYLKRFVDFGSPASRFRGSSFPKNIQIRTRKGYTNVSKGTLAEISIRKSRRSPRVSAN